jgi:hypothetical protein
MFLLQLSIILQLTGALDAFAGFVISVFGFKAGMLTSGLLLLLIGAIFFLAGRGLLKRALRRRVPQPNVTTHRVRPSYFVDNAPQGASKNGNARPADRDSEEGAQEPVSPSLRQSRPTKKGYF